MMAVSEEEQESLGKFAEPFWLPLHSYCALVTQWGTYAPLEACGLIVEMATPGRDRILRLCRNNAEDRSERFEIHPDDLRVTLDQERDGKLTVIGMYHTHPISDAVPSGRDRAGFHMPGWVYVIAGLTGNGGCEVRAWDFVGVKNRPAERLISVSMYRPDK